MAARELTQKPKQTASYKSMKKLGPAFVGMNDARLAADVKNCSAHDITKRGNLGG